MDDNMKLCVKNIELKNPEGIKNIETIFNTYMPKFILLTNQFSKNEVDKDAVVKQLRDFMELIKKQLIGNWCMVETYQEIITALETRVTELGGDFQDIKL